MPKTSSTLPRITVVSTSGQRKQLEAARIEIELGQGRQLILDFPTQAWGDLDILAESQSGTPLLSIQPASSNLVTLRVDARHDMLVPNGDTLQSPFKLALTVQKAISSKLAANLPKKKQLAHWARTALNGDAQVTLRIVDEKESQALNLAYRQKNYPTNVLTFAYDANAESPQTLDPEDPMLNPPTALEGDIVLCAPVIEKEAHEQGKPLAAHYAHLVIHAMLHLQGFDHETDEDANIMEERERTLMNLLGFDDPYQESNHD